MAEILFVTSEILGVLYPSVELALRLKAAGHRVTFSSPPATKQVVVENQIDFLPLDPGRYKECLARDSERSVVSRLFDLGSRRSRALESMAVNAFVDQVRRVEPDLVLIDGEMHEQIIALSAARLPVALLNGFISIWRRPGLPPPHGLVQPGVGCWGSRFGTWLLWQMLWLRKRRRAWSLWLKHVGCDRLSILERLADESGFDLRAEIDDRQWLKPFTYRTLPVLSMHAQDFEFPHQPPRQVRYVGPLLLENRGPAGRGDQGQELEMLLGRCQTSGRPLIFAGFGSFVSTDFGLLRRLIEAVAERRDWDLIISLGGKHEPADLGTLPDSVRAFRWLPQPDVLRHADVAVVHGGINTVDECVLCGVPMLVYCGFETDMAGTTSRIEYHGLGIAGNRQGDDPQAIGRRIDRLLHEPRYQQAIDQMRARYAAYTEDRVAESAVEELLDRDHRSAGRSS